MDAVSREAIEDGHLAVWVVLSAVLEVDAHFTDVLHVRFVLELVQVLDTRLVEIDERVFAECFQEEFDIFNDCDEVLDALLNWSTFGFKLLKGLDLVAQDSPGRVELGSRERDSDYVICYERVCESEVQRGLRFCHYYLNLII